MELLIAVVIVAAIVFGTVWTLKGLGLIKDQKAVAEHNRRLLDLETGLHDLKAYIDQRTPQIPPGATTGAWRPIAIPGKDPELDGVAPEMMGAGDLP